MRKEIVEVPQLKRPDSPFNHVIKVGDILYLTSQLSCDLRTGKILCGNIKEQTENAFENIKTLLENSDSSICNILKVAIFMRDASQIKKMDEVYKKYFPEGKEPARVIIQAQSPIEGIDIEIEVVALTN